MKRYKMKDKNFYEILGVSHFSSQNEIKHAYYTLAKKYHPDINPKTANLFKEINVAYEILSDPVERDKYDRNLQLDAYVKNEEKTKNRSVRRHKAKTSPKSAKESLKESNDYFRKKTEEESFTDFYKDFRYYQDPKKESIFDIIYNWNSYRFENAIKAIWNRWFFSIFGVFLVYLMAVPSIIFTKVFKNIKPKERKRYSWHWISHLHNLIYLNKFWKSITWLFASFALAILKLIFDILYCIYWIFRNILRFFLIPISIIFLGISRYILWLFFGIRIWRR